MGNIVSITKHLTFDSAHYLLNPEYSREKNMAMFHKCCLYKEDDKEEPHGHTYHIEVTVEGTVSEVDGFVIDFKDLKKILKDGILERMDHRLLNDIPYFKDKLATVENILHYVWDEIADQINDLRPGAAWLESIRMWETPNSFATLTRKMKQSYRPSLLDSGLGG